MFAKRAILIGTALLCLLPAACSVKPGTGTPLCPGPDPVCGTDMSVMPPMPDGMGGAPDGAGMMDLRMDLPKDMSGILTMLDFAPMVSYSIGQRANSVAIGDLNGDGKPDLAVVGISSSVIVLLNQGGGIFLKDHLPTYSVGRNPVSVAIGDLDGDGKLDLVVVNQPDNTVTVLLNQGGGTFLKNGLPSYPAGSTPSAVAIGDLNGDGKPDLAVADLSGTSCTGSPVVSVLINQGGGIFPGVNPPNYAVANCPYSVSIDDLNDDGKPDLVTPGELSDRVSVLLNNGDGSFPMGDPARYAVGSMPLSVAIGDLNGDGKPDLAVSNSSDNSVSVLMNLGKGTFPSNNPSTYRVGTYPYSIAIADLNNDSKPDLAVANSRSNDVTVLLNQGSGTFLNKPPTSYPVGSAPYSVAIGDLNGDGKLDLVTANTVSGDVSVLINTSK